MLFCIITLSQMLVVLVFMFLKIFHCKKLRFLASFSDCESLWLQLSCPKNGINFVVGTVYRHPYSNSNEYFDYLNEIFTEINTSKKHYFVLGNININLSSLSTSSFACSKVRDYINMLNSNCSTSIINLPTRVTSSSATVLDQIITNENKHEIISSVIDYDIMTLQIITQ